MSKFSLNRKSILACNVEFLDFLDIILFHIDSTTLTDPLSKVERTRSSEIIALTFLLILPHVILSVISPGHIHDCKRTISREVFFFLLLSELSVRGKEPLEIYHFLLPSCRICHEQEGWWVIGCDIFTSYERYNNGVAFRIIQIDFFFHLNIDT